VKLITTKTNLLASLKNYYGRLREKILELDGNENPHNIPYFCLGGGGNQIYQGLKETMK
jgi:alpha-L-arabinofuranosidase